MDKTKILLFALFMIVFSSFTPNSYALSCDSFTLGEAYEMSEHVFHGKILNTNYFIFDHNPIVTFEVLESFKGKDTGRVSAYIDEWLSYNYVDGFEMIVFVFRDNSVLVASPCRPEFYALPTSIDLVKKLANPDSFMHDKYPCYVHDSYTQDELDKIDEFVEITSERYSTSDIFLHETFHFHIIRDIVLILSFVIGITVIFIRFMRKKRKNNA